MRSRTAVALLGLFTLLGAAVALGAGTSSATGTLTETWVSDTPRENTVNHHAVGAGPDGDVVVAPVAEVVNAGAELTNTSCVLVGLGPTDGSTVWRAGLPAENCTTHALTQPAIDDVDGDGALEAVAVTTENALVARDATTGDEAWRLPLSTFGYGRPTVANLTAAPGPEIVTSDIQGGVLVATGEGSVAWRLDLGTTEWRRPAVWAAPIVTDADADGRPEILVGSGSGPAALAADGSVEWIRNGSAAYVAAAGADDDPAVEVFTAGTSAIRSYDGTDGEMRWQRNLSNARIRAAADADGDGTVELYAGRIDGTVLALDAETGATEWSTTLAAGDANIVVPPVLGDVDGDGTDEVIAVTNGGTVAVLDPGSGTVLGVYERPVPAWTFATPADVDDDGADEVLVRYGDGRVVALDYATR